MQTVPDASSTHLKAIEVEPPSPEPAVVTVNSRSLAKRRATIVDVAELAGVSVSTISNFLNDKGRMSEATRLRVRSAMADLHFTPNSLVKAIRQRRTHIIGVITYGLFDLGISPTQSMMATMLGGINLGADTRGYNVLLYTGWPHRMASTAGLDFLDGHIDGLIWVGPKNNEPALYNVAEAGLPAMVLLSRQVIKGVGCVDVDNVGGIVQVMAHLTGHGHRRIAYAGAIDGRDFVDRLEGYYQGLEIAGIPRDPDLVAANPAISTNWYPNKYTPDYEAAIDRWLSLHDAPTAIVLSTDGWAEWMVEQLTRRGIRVPEDIAVTGFDNVLPERLLDLKLTSVAQDFREIGRLGAVGLADLIDGAPVEQCRTILPAELIVRQSTTGHRFSKTPADD
jgi:DNA-binding LacI/PurR family transcriptional regulator